MIPIGETQDGRADMTNFEMDLFDTRMNSYAVEKEETERCCRHSIIKPACVPISVISLFILMIVFFPLFNDDAIDSALTRYERSGVCNEPCSLQVVESIPTNVTFTNFTKNPSTYEIWRRLLADSKSTLDVAALYWNLRDGTHYPTAWQGNDIFSGFVAAAKRNVKIRIAQNIASEQFAQLDSAYLASHGYASVRSLDFNKLLGSGVLHTKFWIVDVRHIYIGSANMDWKSLTESGPRSFNAKGREEDGDAIVNIMEDAHRFIHIAVMDYLPSTIYMGSNNNTYWSKLDDAIRSAAYRGVTVRMLISHWNHSKPQMKPFLRSLLDINKALPKRHNRTGSIEVKLFELPSDERQKMITFARVNHNKYMVTERIAYVGTSNWVGDYFITTAGVGMSLIAEDVVNSLNAVFLRDWYSQYAHSLT